jgi:hypothetical protein
MRAMKPVVFVAAVALALVLAPRVASAYPQFQLSTGAQRCNQCHISPSGGTLLSGYGRDEAGDTISRGGNGAFLHGAWDPPEWLALGGDVRLAGVLSDVGGPDQPALHVFPMQADLYANLHFGDFFLGGVVGYRGSSRTLQTTGTIDKFWSREHYLMWRPKQQGPYVRAGRFLVPYGLRLAEHPLYIRRWGGQNINEEPYALSGGVVKNEYEWHLTAFTQEPTRCTGQSCAQFGAAGYYEKRFDENAVLGAQVRAAFFDKDDYGYDHYVAGLLGKYWMDGPKLLLQTQLDVGLKPIDAADYTNKELLGYLGATWFATKGLMVTVAGEAWLEDIATPDAERYGGSLEVQWFPYAHIEALVFARKTTDASVVLAQLHYYL